MLDDLTAIVARACAVIGDLSPATVVARMKADQSPVTVADEASQAVILEGLARLSRPSNPSPCVAVVSEESAGNNRENLGDSFLIVDPLDGTREFLAGRDEFTVNLAIISGGVPIAGIIAAPKREQLWRGIAGVKAERLRLLKYGADQPHPIHPREWSRQADRISTLPPMLFSSRSVQSCGQQAARPSSFVRSQKASRMYIRVSQRRANGM